MILIRTNANLLRVLIALNTMSSFHSVFLLLYKIKLFGFLFIDFLKTEKVIVTVHYLGKG